MMIVMTGRYDRKPRCTISFRFMWNEPSPVIWTTGSVREGHLRADSSAVAEAHRTQTAGRQELTDVLAAVVLCGPKLVLTNIGCDDGILRGHPPQTVRSSWCGWMTLSSSFGT